MTIFAIAILIVLGVLLILLEILVIPGVTIAGIGGTISLVAGIILSYYWYGTPIGHYTLVATLFFVVVSLYFALKSKTWNKIALHDFMGSKVENVKDDEIKTGDTGVSISRLNPIGKVLINDKYYEAKSKDEFINQNTKIVVVKVGENKITVKTVSDENQKLEEKT